MPTPDDDSRWTPMSDALERQTERTGSGDLAALDLMKELQGVRLRFTARCLQGDGRVVAPPECVEKFKLSTDLSGVSVFSREPRPPNVLNPIRWSICVWQPEFEPARPLDGGEARNTSPPQQPAPRSEDDNESPDTSSPPPRKRGAKRKLRQKQIERGKIFFEDWLDAHPNEAEASQESLSRTVKDALKFGCSWNTVFRHIVKPVLSERQKKAV